MDTEISVKYGATLTKADVYVTAMNVTAVYTDSLKTQALPDEGVAVYGALTVYVDVADIDGLVTSSNWNATSASNNTDLFNVELPATAVKLAKGGANGKNDDGTDKIFNGTTLNSVTYDNVITLGNISTGNSNEATPLTIKVKSALSSLTIRTRVAESTGGKARAGKTHYYVNGVLVKTVNTVEAFEPLTGLKAGDVVTVWAENTGSGGHFYICGIDAALDTSKAPKLVTVEWLDGSGNVWKTTTHSYCETIVAPEGSPAVSGAHTGWLYNGSDLPADLKLASGSKVQMSPKVETPDITINYTDGGTTNPLSYLSTAAEKEMPAPENGDETHLFIGYYLQDTDQPFDITTAAAGTYNVYVKYMEANLHITYKASDSDAGETIHLFKKSGSEIVDKDGNAAELKGAPEAPDSALPQFDGWYYVPEGGTETKLTNIADLVASDVPHILVAHWKEAKVYQKFLYSTKTVATADEIDSTDTYASGDKIVQNGTLFDAAAATALSAMCDAKTNMTLNGESIARPYGLGSTAITAESELLTITAKDKNIQVTVYLAGGQTNASFGTNRVFTIKGESANGNVVTLNSTSTSSTKRTLVPVTFKISAGDTVTIKVTPPSGKTDGAVYCYGIEAETV